MASDVDICNLALARVGDGANVASIDPPEASIQAQHCARFYPIARDSLLELHAWGFAVRRDQLAELDVDTFNWAHAYAKPNNCLRLLAVLPEAGSPQDDSQRYEVYGNSDGAQAIFTDQENATLSYVARVTDTARFTPLFVDAMGWLLGSYLAGPLIKGAQGMATAKMCLENFRTVVAAAVVSDSKQRMLSPRHAPGWIAGRA